VHKVTEFGLDVGLRTNRTVQEPGADEGETCAERGVVYRNENISVCTSMRHEDDLSDFVGS
jgi:hypothetical protein